MQAITLVLIIFALPLNAAQPTIERLSGKKQTTFTFNGKTQPMLAHIKDAADNQETDFAHTMVFLSSDPVKKYERTISMAYIETRGCIHLIGDDTAGLGEYLQALEQHEQEVTEANLNLDTLQYEPDPRKFLCSLDEYIGERNPDMQRLNKLRSNFAPIIACRYALKHGSFHYYPKPRAPQKFPRCTQRKKLEDQTEREYAELVLFPIPNALKDEESQTSEATASTK